jgi:hypothetical protein
MDVRTLPIAVDVLMIILGIFLITNSLNLWATGESSVLKMEGVVALENVNKVLSTGIFAGILYWFGFMLLMFGVYGIVGSRGTFVTWAVISAIFEVATVILVATRYSEESFKDTTNIMLLASAGGLVLLLGLVMNTLYSRLGIE